MDIKTALLELGVTDSTLTTAEKDQLDRDGYLPLSGILSAEQIAQFQARLDDLIVAEGADAGKEVHQEAGTDRLSDLVNKGDLFTICFTHPRVLAAISHVLQGDLKLSSLNFRAALPGDGLQALHCDWKGGSRAGGIIMFAIRFGCLMILQRRMAQPESCPVLNAWVKPHRKA